MTNTLAIGIVIVVAAFFALDHFVLHLDAATFLFRKFLDLIRWAAFWR